MTWFKVDDGFHLHPKVVAAGNEAVGLFVRLGAYAGQHLTDGFVPREIGRMYGSSRMLTRLVDVGLLELADGGWLIHDFLAYNPSREAVCAERDRKSRAGIAGAKARWSKAGAIADGMAPAMAEGTGGSDAPVPTRPLPPNPPQAGGGCGRHKVRAKSGCHDCAPTPVPPPLHVVLAEQDRITREDTA